MTVLEDFQFEVNGYVFGRRCPVFVDTAGFDPGSAEWTTQDTTNPMSGATNFGRDVLSGPEWTWMLHVDGDQDLGESDGLRILGEMGAAWRNGANGYKDSSVVLPLRYRLAGRTRVVFGRPRRFDYKPDGRILGGYLPPSASFKTADPLHYDDVESGIDITLAPPISGGTSFPAVFPITFRRDPGYLPPSALVVGGDAPTAPIVEFIGPVLNPSVTIGAFTIGLTGQIGEGGIVTMDARPWINSITRSGNTAGASVSRATRLTAARLRPGNYSAVFRGQDASGQGRCRVRWRNAWHTL